MKNLKKKKNPRLKEGRDYNIRKEVKKGEAEKAQVKNKETERKSCSSSQLYPCRTGHLHRIAKFLAAARCKPYPGIAD